MSSITDEATLGERPPTEDEPPRLWRWPVVAMAVGAAVLVVFGLLSQLVTMGYGLFSHLPIYGGWRPVLSDKALTVIPTTVLLAAIAAIVGSNRRFPTKILLPVTIAAGVVTAATIALVRGKVDDLSRGVSTAPNASYYTSDLHFVQQYGIRGFVQHYADLALVFHSPNSRTHPAGALLLLDGLYEFFGKHPLRVSTTIAVIAMCAAIPAWAIGRELGGERSGRIAAVLFVAAPGALIFAYTAMDAVYATGLAAAAAVFMIAIRRRSPIWAAAGGAILGLVTTLTYATSFVAIAAALAVVIQTRSVRDSLRLLGAAAAGGAVVVVIAWLGLGFDFVASYRNAPHINPARWTIYWLPGSPAALLIMAGIPIAALSLIAMIRPVPGTQRAILPLVLFVFFVLWAAAPTGITHLRPGETERTWAFLYPMLAAAAATVVDRWTAVSRSALVRGGVIGGLVVVSVAQATLISVLWDTVF